MSLRSIRSAISLLVAMTILLGIAYPLLIAALAKLAFPLEAEGSLIREDGKLVGSALIGQSFSDPKYFWGRPSATTPQPYNGLASGGSNLGPLNPDLLDAVKTRAKALHGTDPDKPIPVDLVSASGSGLDPDISIAAALYQAARVARARGVGLKRVEALIDAHQEERLFGFVGEPRVNVLTLNLALDRMK